MEDKMKTTRDFITRFNRFINKFNELEKMPYNFGIDEMLYPSEIHTIQAIGNNNGINVTALAQRLGVTKGAVSQMITKLKNRGLISKMRSMDNNKEVLLILTAKGQKAFEGHERFHNEMYMDFTRYIGDLTSKELDVFKTVLDKVDFYIDRYRIK